MCGEEKKGEEGQIEAMANFMGTKMQGFVGLNAGYQRLVKHIKEVGNPIEFNLIKIRLMKRSISRLFLSQPRVILERNSGFKMHFIYFWV